MLLNDVKIIGTVDGEEAVAITINSLCPLKVVEEMCSALRNGMNNMGSGIDFEISFKDVDI